MRLLGLALLLALCACAKTRQPEPEAGAKPSAAPPSAQLRYGGDTAAWLGPLGNMQDQAYCTARLKLPLTSKPAWELGYTSAEFSAFAPSPIVHYNGTLAVCARSPQLMLLDADSGRIIANKDVYERRGGENALEALETIFVSPSGRLLACDVSNAFYCFDLRELNRLWYRGTSPRSNEGGAPLVVDGTSLYTSWGEARNWNLHALDVATGGIGWGYPSTFDPEGQGVTLSQSGILLGYAFPSQLRALRASDGQPLWTVHERAQVALAPIDEQRQLIYAILHDESLACRDLSTGALRWRYSWADLLSDTVREDLMVRSGLRALTGRRLEVQANALCVTGSGVFASLQTGEVFHLGPDGKRRWQVRLDAQVVSLLAFDNALLAVQQYQIPDVQDPNSDGELGQASPPDQFNLTRPDWPNLQPASGVRKAVFSRVVALSLTDGAILSTVDTDVASLSNLCPAGARLVFGGVRRGERSQAASHYITAYDWVEQ